MGKDARMNWFEDHWEMLIAFGGLAVTGLKGFMHLRDSVKDMKRDQIQLAIKQDKIEKAQEHYMEEMRGDLKEVHARVTMVANSTARIEGMLAARHHE